MKKFKVFIIIFIALLATGCILFIKSKKNAAKPAAETVAKINPQEIYTSDSMNVSFKTLGFVVQDPLSSSQEAPGSEKNIFTAEHGLELSYPEDTIYYPNGGEIRRPYLFFSSHSNPKKLSLDNWVKQFVSQSANGYCPPVKEGDISRVDKNAIPKVEEVKTKPYRLVRTDNSCQYEDFLHFFSNTDSSVIYALYFNSLRFSGGETESDKQKYFVFFDSITILQNNK